jgi:2-polyprenyl-3-methyl-5-hydroxy-6-metoxy-1,4-benzoquinol methylase
MSIEEVKNYWNNRPCNIKYSKKEINTIEYFNEVEAKKYFVEPHIYKLADFQKWKGKKVLELGCGIGSDSINFARYGADLTVVDISDVSLDICKKRFELFGLNARFFNMNIEEIDFQNEKFDLIYSFGVIHHTVEPRNVIKKVEKLLNDDGEFRFMVYSKISYKLFWVMMEHNIKDINEGFEKLKRESEAQTNCPITHLYTFDDIRNNLLTNKFEIIDIWKDFIFTYDINEYYNNNYIKDQYWKDMDDEKINEMAKDLGWNTMVICKLKNQ